MRGSSGTIRVLHVDDEPDFAEMAAEFLHREDDELDIHTATTANEGLERLTNEGFECVISDYDMPGTDGIEFLEAVRDAYPDLPFILYTGKGSEEVASEAITAGVTDYLQKSSGTSQYAILANRVRNAVERHQSRHAVEETEEKLSQLADRTDDILFMFNSDWSELLFLNSAFEDVWGIPAERLEEDPQAFIEAIHPEDREKARQSMERISRGRTDVVEYRIIPPEGDQRWIRGNSKPIFDEDGNVTRIVGFVRDITERKQEEQRRENIIDRVTDAIVEVDADWRFTLLNEEAEELYEMSEEELLGRDFWDVFTEARGTRFEEEYRAVMESREPTSFEAYYSGLDYWFEIEAYPKDTGGIAFYFRNVTDRIQRVRELEQKREQHRYLEELAEIGYWELDTQTPEPHDVMVSDGVYRVHEISADDSFDVEKGLEFYHPEDREQVSEAVDRAVSAGEPYEFEARLITASGKERWVHSVGEPVERDGEIVKVRGVFQDITEQKRREQELSRQNERLDEFASIVSHDLRNPLNVLEGRLALLREECDSEHLDPMDAAVDRVNRLIGDVLWLAREGQDIGTTAPVSVEVAVGAAWDIVADGNERAELHVDGEEPLPTVSADEARFKQLLENVLRNAIEHGGEAVTVTVGRLDDGFYLEDDGPGIPADVRAQVFDAGYSSTDDGTGFGLNIVSKVAEAHGWEIHVTDGADGGARFEISGVQFAEG